MEHIEERWLTTIKALFTLRNAGVIKTEDLEECLDMVDSYIENKYGKV